MTEEKKKLDPNMISQNIVFATTRAEMIEGGEIDFRDVENIKKLVDRTQITVSDFFRARGELPPLISIVMGTAYAPSGASSILQMINSIFGNEPKEGTHAIIHGMYYYDILDDLGGIDVLSEHLRVFLKKTDAKCVVFAGEIRDGDNDALYVQATHADGTFVQTKARVYKNKKSSSIMAWEEFSDPDIVDKFYDLYEREESGGAPVGIEIVDENDPIFQDAENC